jgi:hypothetical protein
MVMYALTEQGCVLLDVALAAEGSVKSESHAGV